MLETLSYLDQHLLREDRLLAQSGLDAAALQRLQQSGCLPQVCYRLDLAGKLETLLPQTLPPATLRWHSVGSLRWLGVVDALGADAPALQAEFARRLRAAYDELAGQGLPHPLLEQAPALQTRMDEEWRHFLAGHYGVCTRHALPEEIAAKDVAIGWIDRLTDRQTRAALTGNDRQRLEQAVSLLDRVSLPFAPHERAASSRARCVDRVRTRYLETGT